MATIVDNSWIVDYAYEKLEEYGLDDWNFIFDNAKMRFGQCDYGTKTISLSRHLVNLNGEEKIKDTILHEVAHAIVGHAAGHGWQWQQKAIEIGCNGERCYDPNEVATPAHTYEGRCDCGTVVKRHRKSQKMYRLACKSCCQEYNLGYWSDRFLLNWVKVR